MSNTTSFTLLQTPPSHSFSENCPKCGARFQHAAQQALERAQVRIQELESQISILTLRATTAVEKANEYETSLRRFNSTRSNTCANGPVSSRETSFEGGRTLTPSMGRATSDSPTSPTPVSVTPQSPPKPVPASAASRLARLLPTRSISAASAPSTALAARPQSTTHDSHPLTAGFNPTVLPPNTPQELNLDLPQSTLVSPSPSELSLISALTHEQSLRKAAESAAAKTNNEIEELTGQLFEQANEMVAQERKTRARLEERVNVLEKREGEKSQRLQTLETRIGRVERVRGLLEREQAITAVSKSDAPISKDPIQREEERKQP